jgi:hypothetical protein
VNASWQVRGRLLLGAGLLSAQSLEEAFAVFREDQRQIAILKAERRFEHANQVLQLLLLDTFAPWISFKQIDFQAELLSAIPAEVAVRLRVIPLYLARRKDSEILYVATDIPDNTEALQGCKEMLGVEVRPMYSMPEAMQQALRTCYPSAMPAASPSSGKQRSVNPPSKPASLPPPPPGSLIPARSSSPPIVEAAAQVLELSDDEFDDLNESTHADETGEPKLTAEIAVLPRVQLADENGPSDTIPEADDVSDTLLDEEFDTRETIVPDTKEHDDDAPALVAQTVTSIESEPAAESSNGFRSSGKRPVSESVAKKTPVGVLLMIDADSAFVDEITDLAESYLLQVETCESQSAKRVVFETKPLLILLTDDVYSFDRIAYNLIAIEAKSVLIVWDTNLPTKSISPILVSVVRESEDTQQNALSSHAI